MSSETFYSNFSQNAASRVTHDASNIFVIYPHIPPPRQHIKHINTSAHQRINTSTQCHQHINIIINTSTYQHINIIINTSTQPSTHRHITTPPPHSRVTRTASMKLPNVNSRVLCEVSCMCVCVDGLMAVLMC